MSMQPMVFGTIVWAWSDSAEDDLIAAGINSADYIRQILQFATHNGRLGGSPAWAVGTLMGGAKDGTPVSIRFRNVAGTWTIVRVETSVENVE